MEETLSEVQEASRTSSEASANRNEASLQEEIETLKVIHMMIDSHIKVCILCSVS